MLDSNNSSDRLAVNPLIAINPQLTFANIQDVLHLVDYHIALSDRNGMADEAVTNGLSHCITCAIAALAYEASRYE